MINLTKDEAYVALLACGELLTQQGRRTPQFFTAEDFREAKRLLSAVDMLGAKGREASETLMNIMRKLQAEVLAS